MAGLDILTPIQQGLQIRSQFDQNRARRQQQPLQLQQQQLGLQQAQLGLQQAQGQSQSLQELAPFAQRLFQISDDRKLGALQNEKSARQAANLDTSIIDEGIALAQAGDFNALNETLGQIIQSGTPAPQEKVGRFRSVQTSTGSQTFDTATGKVVSEFQDPGKIAKLEAKEKTESRKKELEENKIEGQRIAKLKVESERKFEADNAISGVDQTIETATNLLNHPGLSSAAGAGSALPTLPGSNAADFEALLESFDAQLFLSQVEKMKGLGALSEGEGKKLAASVESLSLSQSDAQLKKNFQNIIDTMNDVKRRVQKKFNIDTKGADTQPGQPSQPEQQFREGQTARNPQTGQTAVFRNGQWQIQ